MKGRFDVGTGPRWRGWWRAAAVGLAVLMAGLPPGGVLPVAADSAPIGQAAAAGAPGAVPGTPPGVPAAPAVAARRWGIQGGWAVADDGAVEFPHSLYGQLPLIQTSGAGWVRINFRLGAAYRTWTDRGANGRTALEQYDRVVDEARARGLAVLGVLSNESWPGGQADWTAGNAEHGLGNGDNGYLAAFSRQAAVTLARHFQGRIDQWEVWNEPNVWGRNPRPGVYEGATFLYPSNLAWLLRHVYEDTRAAGLANLTFVSGGVYAGSIAGVSPSAGDRGSYVPATAGGVFLGIVPADLNSGAAYLTATYQQGIARAGWDDVRRRLGTYPLDAIGQHLYVDQGGRTSPASLVNYLNHLRAAYAAFEGAGTSKQTVVTEVGWNAAGVQADNVQIAYAVFRAVPYVKNAYWFSVQDIPEGDVDYGLYSEGSAGDGYRGAFKPAFHAYQYAVGAVAAAASRASVQAMGGSQVLIQVPGRFPLLVDAGAVPRLRDQWCSRDRVYRAYLRLQDVGLAGATFGVVDATTLDWIPPEDAACVDWSKVDQSLNVPKEAIAQFALLRLRPGALLWVLDGADDVRGSLYEVDRNGQARHVTGAYWAKNQPHFQQVWGNVLPVVWSQVLDLRQRGLIGPDLS